MKSYQHYFDRRRPTLMTKKRVWTPMLGIYFAAAPPLP